MMVPDTGMKGCPGKGKGRFNHPAKEELKMSTALSVIFVFGLMILIHEFGHYIVARWNGIKVLEFSFGFGPKIIGYQGKETFYAIRLVPLGGFVRMYGMDSEKDDSGEMVIAPPTDERSYMNKRVWQRMAVIAAGPIMNFVLAVVLFIGIFAYMGIPVQSTDNVVGSLVEGKPAVAAGIQPGDRIVAVNGQATPDWQSLTDTIHSKPNQPLTVTFERNNQKDMVKITSLQDSSTGFGIIGIAPQVNYEQASVLQAAQYGLERTYDFTKYIIIAFVEMITGKIPADVGGPIAIAQVTGDAAARGWADLLSLTAVLSIQLGIINLFPIPALDGSRLVFLLVEGLRGKPLNPARENLIHMIGFVLLLAAMLAITYHDIMKLFTK